LNRAHLLEPVDASSFASCTLGSAKVARGPHDPLTVRARIARFRAVSEARSTGRVHHGRRPPHPPSVRPAAPVPLLVVWNVLLVLSGLGVFATVTGCAASLAGGAPAAVRVEHFAAALTWSLPFALVMLGRTRWLRTRGIYESYACLREAVSASFHRPRVATPDSEELLHWLETHGLQRATFPTVYEYARGRRQAAPDGEREFRWVAEMMYRLLASDLHRHTAHVRGPYHPSRTLGISLIGAAGIVLGIAAFVWALGPVQGPRATGFAAAVLCTAIGAGVAMRLKWALHLALVALGCGALALMSLLATERLPASGAVLPLLAAAAAMHLFRRREWFVES
jgi:hypothetical protein